MQSRYSQHYEVLQNRPIPFIYQNDGHDLCAYRPVFERDIFGQPSTIAWSPPFQGNLSRPPLTSGNDKYPLDDEGFLQAINAWEELLNESARKFEFTMEEGDLVLFDNRRALHARRDFRDLMADEAKERGVEVSTTSPNRWLKGCYLDGDAVWDKLAVLKAKHNEREREP